MDTELLKTVGEIGGIGGIALGILLLFFRDLIRQSAFKKLPPAKASRLITLISVLVWSSALAGIGVYTVTISKDDPNLSVNHGVGAGGSITGSKITIETSASTTGTSSTDGIHVEGGVTSGGDIKDSQIEITHSKTE